MRSWAHGWRRASDRGARDADAVPERVRRGRGLPFLMTVSLLVLTWVGITKVRTRVRVLELGQQITELTEQRALLLDRKRRLETERAFLRHPDRIRDEAMRRFDMIPAAPERIRRVQPTLSQARGS
ncbi:MAG: hypothetical protein B7733_03805 [Myxococcales bacterium FL481]|nr:MAG: hypothetical protein B7733_03805 [Myxococcales bacterium FL481]